MKFESTNVRLSMARLYTRDGHSVWDTTGWRITDAEIVASDGRVVFRQSGVEAPSSWSDQAVRVAASKYFAGALGSPERETSVRQLIARVASTITAWAAESGIFRCDEDVTIFGDELTYLLLHQHASFNSPVWFNVGVRSRPQCSACFINSVEDHMESILELAKTEGLLFKHGSGTGTNLSVLRGSEEKLSNGGAASGPVSFMRGFDAFAGVIKSGGRTRRAAKMVILDADHPDILEFIRSKAHEERKAWALIDAGYDGSIDGEAYGSVAFQNANHSVRVPDVLIDAWERGESWCTRRRTDNRVAARLQASDLLEEMASAAWVCGDPGIQYDDAIQRWHTCKASGPIRGSNPCSEYLFLDDTACNLASINLMHYADDDAPGGFDTRRFVHTVRILITAMETLVGCASYPTERIAANSHRYRPLGLGYANLGALLMARTLPYDSPEARDYAAAITALMSGTAYEQSARLAQVLGPFEGYTENEASMMEVMELHRGFTGRLESAPPALSQAAIDAWQAALARGKQHGYRNAQATVLAPTGTIGLLMDCDTTGVEPDIALVKYKRLVGGGTLKFVNRTVSRSLSRLGYSGDARQEILRFVEREGTIEGAPGFDERHLAVFDCAFAHGPSGRTISPAGHLSMMAAVQPFLSGAISKTVNLPSDASIADIMDVFRRGHRLGLKAVAVYRDGCKRIQPLSIKQSESPNAKLSLPHFVTRHGARTETPLCPSCGGMQVRSGSCYVCSNCGETTACA